MLREAVDLRRKARMLCEDKERAEDQVGSLRKQVLAIEAEATKLENAANQERDMGTGVKGSEQVETAASAMRKQAENFRARAKGMLQVSEESLEDSRRQAEKAAAWNAEATKLENAANLVAPAPSSPTTRVGAEDVERATRVEDGTRAEDGVRFEKNYIGDGLYVGLIRGGPGDEKQYAPRDTRVRGAEVYDWKNDATVVIVTGHGPNGIVFSLGVPAEDFRHIGTPEFNQRIERLINAKTRNKTGSER